MRCGGSSRQPQGKATRAARDRVRPLAGLLVGVEVSHPLVFVAVAALLPAVVLARLLPAGPARDAYRAAATGRGEP
jgi:hypothetical protein